MIIEMDFMCELVMRKDELTIPEVVDKDAKLIPEVLSNFHEVVKFLKNPSEMTRYEQAQ